VASLEAGDFSVYYARLRLIITYVYRLVFAIIGFYQVEKIEWVKNIQGEDTHRRKNSIYTKDIPNFLTLKNLEG
jgi:hypothetical protein